MWPFTEKKEILYSNKAPYHYFAVYNTFIQIAKEHGKLYDHLSLERLVFLTYCIYYAGYNRPLIYESFYIFSPGIILTDSIWEYEVYHNISNDKPVSDYIGEKYDMLIDKKCSDYNFIEMTYDKYSKYSDTELYIKIKDSEIKLKDGTVLPCPSKKLLLENGFEKYYNGGQYEYSYREEALKKIYKSKIYIDVNYVRKYYSELYEFDKKYLNENENL